mmetsp:Transcript_28708/g.74397  ORF Transcript_28708/g.74397 Transcript_28708/m.74397 type:complete len:307 (-) Transcript_28708:70-990(-)
MASFHTQAAALGNTSSNGGSTDVKKDGTIERHPQKENQSPGHLDQSPAHAPAAPATLSPDRREAREVAPHTPHPREAVSPNSDELTVLLEKRLTSSDSNGAGRVVIPKAAAEEHFPEVSATTGLPIQFQDSYGTVHPLLLRYWDNKASRIYILEGTAAIQRLYSINKGDTLAFLRARDGSFHVRGHRGWQGDKSQRVTYSKKTKAPPQAQPNVRRRKLANPMPAPLATIDVVYKLDVEAGEALREDGVFRAVHASLAGPGPAGVRQLQGGNWTAVIDFKGEQFQAFFASEREASEAFAAAGGKKSN